MDVPRFASTRGSRLVPFGSAGRVVARRTWLGMFRASGGAEDSRNHILSRHVAFRLLDTSVIQSETSFLRLPADDSSLSIKL